MGKLRGCQGPAEELALTLRATLGLKVCPLFLRFDTFGNHEVLESLSHVNYGAHDGGNFPSAGRTADQQDAFAVCALSLPKTCFGPSPLSAGPM